MVHRDVLCNSTLVRNLIEAAGGNTIIHPACNPKTFDRFLKYLYTGQIDTPTFEKLAPLYVMAQLHGIESLQNELIKNFETLAPPNKKRDRTTTLEDLVRGASLIYKEMTNEHDPFRSFLISKNFLFVQGSHLNQVVQDAMTSSPQMFVRDIFEAMNANNAKAGQKRKATDTAEAVNDRIEPTELVKRRNPTKSSSEGQSKASGNGDRSHSNKGYNATIPKEYKNRQKTKNLNFSSDDGSDSHEDSDTFEENIE
jgi:hypothetical protein